MVFLVLPFEIWCSGFSFLGLIVPDLLLWHSVFRRCWFYYMGKNLCKSYGFMEGLTNADSFSLCLSYANIKYNVFYRVKLFQIRIYIGTL